LKGYFIESKTTGGLQLPPPTPILQVMNQNMRTSCMCFKRFI